jgi:hypothetical protein
MMKDIILTITPSHQIQLGAGGQKFKAALGHGQTIFPLQSAL